MHDLRWIEESRFGRAMHRLTSELEGGWLYRLKRCVARLQE